jgi:hypothetical protein
MRPGGEWGECIPGDSSCAPESQAGPWWPASSLLAGAAVTVTVAVGGFGAHVMSSSSSTASVRDSPKAQAVATDLPAGGVRAYEMNLRTWPMSRFRDAYLAPGA